MQAPNLLFRQLFKTEKNTQYHIILSPQKEKNISNTSLRILYCLESIIKVFTRKKIQDLQSKTITDILTLVSNPKPLETRSCDEIYRSFSRFTHYLNLVNKNQYLSNKIYQIFKHLTTLMKQHKAESCGAVLTKTTSSIALILFSANGKQKEDQLRVIIFDPQSREDHQGAAFLLFSKINYASQYLSKIFPTAKIKGIDRFQSELLNTIEVSSFVLNDLSKTQNSRLDEQLFEKEMKSLKGFVVSSEDFEKEILDEFPKNASQWISALHTENQFLHEKLLSLESQSSKQQQTTLNLKKQIKLSENICKERDMLITKLCEKLEHLDEN
ncbi:hypothetical protein M0812_02159 [Anaeramoeba flamelloides]|uniref:Uncharacterized protein n=1 Tax=Anaeramoeba flamelloides TaxID=1746091 RepID=A0AAV7YZR9_9EUKA|nr:hypothetical protein M0812_02159 [Anaeramoeba flamelloides]